MDNVKFENIKSLIRNTSLFFEIFNDSINKFNQDKNEENLNKIVKQLKMQHSTNQHILEEFGYDFNNNKKIKEYNENIRKLEEKIGQNSNLDFSTICHFLNNKKSELSEKLKNKYGLYFHMELSVNSEIEIVLNHMAGIMPFHKNTLNSLYIKTEEDLKEKEEEHLRLNSIVKDSFDLNSEGNLFFNEKNKSALETIIYNEFSEIGSVNNIDFKLDNFSQNSSEMFTISKVKFHIICLQSTLNFHKAMSERF